MSDDNKLMEQFISKATPKLLEALAEQIKPMVEDQIGGLKSASEKMLDQIKDRQRADDETRAKQARDAQQLKTLLERRENPKTTLDLMNPEPIQLTRDQARNATLYRRAKAQAEASGTTVQILADRNSNA